MVMLPGLFVTVGFKQPWRQQQKYKLASWQAKGGFFSAGLGSVSVSQVACVVQVGQIGVNKPQPITN